MVRHSGSYPGENGKLLLKMSLLRFCKMNLVCNSRWTSWAASRKYSACDWRVGAGIMNPVVSAEVIGQVLLQ